MKRWRRKPRVVRVKESVSSNTWMQDSSHQPAFFQCSAAELRKMHRPHQQSHVHLSHCYRRRKGNPQLLVAPLWHNTRLKAAKLTDIHSTSMLMASSLLLEWSASAPQIKSYPSHISCFDGNNDRRCSGDWHLLHFRRDGQNQVRENRKFSARYKSQNCLGNLAVKRGTRTSLQDSGALCRVQLWKAW